MCSGVHADVLMKEINCADLRTWILFNNLLLRRIHQILYSGYDGEKSKAHKLHEACIYDFRPWKLMALRVQLRLWSMTSLIFLWPTLVPAIGEPSSESRDNWWVSWWEFFFVLDEKQNLACTSLLPKVYKWCKIFQPRGRRMLYLFKKMTIST